PSSPRLAMAWSPEAHCNAGGADRCGMAPGSAIEIGDQQVNAEGWSRFPGRERSAEHRSPTHLAAIARGRNWTSPAVLAMQQLRPESGCKRTPCRGGCEGRS